MESQNNMELATIGGGCFWCVEAVFLKIKGVEKVVSGYSGGEAPNPTYEEVCRGQTGHAEVCQITFNPNIISYREILNIFWKTHDPTTLNRQGADVGTQYRSVIFYHNENQQKIAQNMKKDLDASDTWKNSIVTEISPLINFYPAEDYHQNYYALNPRQSYCQVVIQPKLEKAKKYFFDKLKE